jgi:hypothetical protein
MGAGIIINIFIILFNLVIVKFMIFRKQSLCFLNSLVIKAIDKCFIHLSYSLKNHVL